MPSILSLIVVAATVSPADSATSWSFQEVEAGGVGWYPSIALDSAGRPHIAYNTQNNVLRYARWSGEVWVIETVDGSHAGSRPSLALDSSDNPRVSYWRGTTLGYAERNDGLWTCESIPDCPPCGGECGTAGDYGRYNSLALDANDEPHIAYYVSEKDGLQSYLKYVRRVDQVWCSYSCIDGAETYSGEYCKLVLDATGRPHVAYYDNELDDLRYALKSPTGPWLIDIVDSQGNVGRFPSIALDGAGNPAISYTDQQSPPSLNFAAKISSGWDIATVESGLGSQIYSALVFDAADVPHIAYADAGFLGFHYGARPSPAGPWELEFVENGTDVGRYPAMALDAQGDPHVAYFDATQARMMYAHGTTPQPPPVPQFVEDVQLSATTLTLGQMLTITARVQNDGGASDEGGISFSFPSLTAPQDDQRVVSTSGGDYPGHTEHPAGSTIHDMYCEEMPAQYLLTEYVDCEWEGSGSETNEYVVSVKPQAAGTFYVDVRSTMHRAGAGCEWVNALPPNGLGGYTDQQGWPVKRFAVTVLEPAATLVVYMNGDNSLDAASFEDFNEMESAAGVNPEVAIVVCWDRLGDHNTAYYHVQSDPDPGALASYQEGLNKWSQDELDMGDPVTLVAFGSWALSEFPSALECVVVWNHGGGWGPKGISWDMTDGSNFLTTNEVRDAVAAVAQAAGRAIDVLGLDACLMAMAEVAYAVRSTCAYVVGSEETEPEDGWEYDQFIPGIHRGMSPADLCGEIVLSYPGPTQSAFECGDDLDLIAARVDVLARAMIENIGGELPNIQAARSDPALVTFDYDGDGPENSDSYVDLAHVCELISANSANQSIRDAANGVIGAVVSSLVAQMSVGPYYLPAGGMSIYFPDHMPDWVSFAGQAYDLYANYQNEGDSPAYLDFVADTYWNEFLAAFLGDQTYVASEEAGRKQVFFLGANSPNPATTTTEIGYQIPRTAGDSRIRLCIYDTRGRLVKALVDAEGTGGSYAVSWDGTDYRGSAVASGVYFYRLEWNGRTEMKRMVLVR